MPTWPTWSGSAPTSAGSDPRVDEAVALAPRIEAMLRQGRHDPSDLGASFAELAAAMEMPDGA